MLDLYKRSLCDEYNVTSLISMSDKDIQLYISATLNSRVSKAKGYLNGPPSEEGETADADKKLQTFHRTLSLHTQHTGEIHQANHTMNKKEEDQAYKTLAKVRTAIEVYV